MPLRSLHYVSPRGLLLVLSAAAVSLLTLGSTLRAPSSLSFAKTARHGRARDAHNSDETLIASSDVTSSSNPAAWIQLAPLRVDSYPRRLSTPPEEMLRCYND